MGGGEAYQTVPRRLLPRVVRIGARHPGCGTLPVDVQTLPGPADDCRADLPACHALLAADLREQRHRPRAPRLAQEARAPGQECAPLGITLRRPDGLED